MNVISWKTIVTAFMLSIVFNNPSLHAMELDELKKYAMHSEAAPLLSRAVFNWQSPLQQVKLAHDGKSIVYVMDKDHFQEIWRYDIAGRDHLKLLSVKQVDELHWSADSQHVFFANQNVLYRIRLSSQGVAEKIYDFSDVHTHFYKPDGDIDEVLWARKYHPRTQTHQLVKVNLTGNEEVVFETTHPIDGFFTQQGSIQLVELWVGNQIEVSELTATGLKPLLTCGPLQPCTVKHWDKSLKTLTMTAYFDQDVLSLFKVDLNNGTKTVLHQDPNQRFDLDNLVLAQDGRPYLASYQTEYTKSYALTDDAQKVLTQINETVPSQLNWVSMSKNQQTWLVIDAAPRHASRHIWLLERGKQAWHQPFAHIKTERMPAKWIAPRVPFWYITTDGMEQLGYVTLPLGIDPKTAPLVVNPHGGPWNRSQGTFNRYAQFLANRGYVVFEPNFRSSTGFGRHYLLSANKDFGNGRVQQDILDGTDYLLNHGIGDRNKQAIAGHSFGGFSALNALAFTPERFKVAFAGAAPMNLTNTILRYAKTIAPSNLQRSAIRFRELMVDIENAQDVKRLYDQSPDKHWANIDVPLYMWAGEKDDRVAIEDVRDIALRLQSISKSVVLVSDPKAGHSPVKRIAREAYLYTVEKALARGVGGRQEVETSANLKRYLKRFTQVDTINFVDDTRS